MRRIDRPVQHQSTEPLDRQLASRLAREHHEHDPLQLLGIGLVGIECELAVERLGGLMLEAPVNAPH